MQQQAPTTPAKITFADGNELVLRYSNAALRAIKAEYGVSPMREGVQKLYEKIDEDRLPKLLVLGLDHHFGGKPGITEADVDELVDAQNTLHVLQQVFMALGSSILKNALDIVLGAVAKAQQAQQPEPETQTEPLTPVM